MKLRKTLAAAGALAIAGGMFAASPSQAAQTGSTDATFTIQAGTLDITVPASTVNLGTVNLASTAPSTLTGNLGNVQVVDNRGALLGIWTASARTTDFTTGATPGVNQTVPAASVAYAAIGASKTGGGALSQLLTPGAAALNSALDVPVVNLAAGVGINSAEWDAQLTFTLLPTQVAGTYTGTVTHSVA